LNKKAAKAKGAEKDKNLLGLEVFNVDSETASTGQASSSDLGSNLQTTNRSSYREESEKSDEDEDDLFGRRTKSQQI